MSEPDAYDKYLAEWKSKQGVKDAEAVGPELKMLAQDAKDRRKDYCVGCGEQFRICDMRLILRSVDPYVQFDDDKPTDSEYIKKEHRVRRCLPCYKEEYESEETP